MKFEGEDGSTFAVDAAGIDVAINGDETIVALESILAFAIHVRGGYSPEEQVRQGAAFWNEVEREVDKEPEVDKGRERREFIRRAAVDLCDEPMGHKLEKSTCIRAWMNAKLLWETKPEDC